MSLTVIFIITFGIIIFQWLVSLTLLMVDDRLEFENKREFLFSLIPFIWIWLAIRRAGRNFARSYEKLDD